MNTEQSAVHNTAATTTGKKPTIEEILHKNKLTIDDLVRCGREGLTATRIQRDRYGDSLSEDPDYATRHKFFASFMELLGYMSRENRLNVQVVNNISPQERELLDAYRRREPEEFSWNGAPSEDV